MIGFNGTYLDRASHGNMRITAASIGGQWVMPPWNIAAATQQAIIAAFGAEEGTEVIIRTNDYLNAIAATDTTRAQQLANFINEDPLLVCSLVETSKMRWLVGDGKAWIAIDDVPINGDTYEDYFWKVKTILKYTGAGWTTQGIGGGSVCTTGMGISSNKNWAWADGITDVQGTNATEYFDKVLVQELDFTNRTFKVWDENDNEVYSVSGINVRKPANTGYNILFGWRNYSKSQKYIHPAKDAYAILRAGGKHKHLLPFHNGTESGMLDIISCQFYPNANTEGAFTIALTDKTPA